jgi:hypothetical protein
VDKGKIMRTMVLRFRDLSIPDGETIIRHNKKIVQHQKVWWGWIGRQREIFPNQYLEAIAAQAAAGAGIEIYLYHSGFALLYPARLTQVSALPSGQKVRTPELRCTPEYMNEAQCAAWFCISDIQDAVSSATIEVETFPTLVELKKPDDSLLRRSLSDLEELRISTATLWDASVQH